MLRLIVKRKGHREYFDERKVYASVFAACMTLRMRDTEAETLADMVTHEVKEKIEHKESLDTEVLFRFVADTLAKYHPDAAYMYETHRDIQ